MVKNLPANAGDAREEGSILGQEDPLEEGMPTHSSIFAWKIPWTEEPDELHSYSPRGHKKSNTIERLTCRTGNYVHYGVIAYKRK